jgi:hypothetical protein
MSSSDEASSNSSSTKKRPHADSAHHSQQSVKKLQQAITYYSSATAASASDGYSQNKIPIESEHKKRKAAHNLSEKKRQRRISQQFDELKQLVQAASGRTIRRGRGQILAAAHSLISYNIQERQMSAIKSNQLQYEMNSLKHHLYNTSNLAKNQSILPMCLAQLPHQWNNNSKPNNGNSTCSSSTCSSSNSNSSRIDSTSSNTSTTFIDHQQPTPSVVDPRLYQQPQQTAQQQYTQQHTLKQPKQQQHFATPTTRQLQQQLVQPTQSELQISQQPPQQPPQQPSQQPPQQPQQQQQQQQAPEQQQYQQQQYQQQQYQQQQQQNRQYQQQFQQNHQRSRIQPSSNPIHVSLQTLIENSYAKTASLWRWSAGRLTTDVPRLLMDEMSIGGLSSPPLVDNTVLVSVGERLSKRTFRPPFVFNVSDSDAGPFDILVSIQNLTSTVTGYGPKLSKSLETHAKRLTDNGYLILITYDGTTFEDICKIFDGPAKEENFHYKSFEVVDNNTVPNHDFCDVDVGNELKVRFNVFRIRCVKKKKRDINLLCQKMVYNLVEGTCTHTYI